MLGEAGQRRTELDEIVLNEIYLADSAGYARRGFTDVLVKHVIL